MNAHDSWERYPTGPAFAGRFPDETPPPARNGITE